MLNPGEERSLIDSERLVLQALCQDTPKERLRKTAKRLLADYRWRKPIHQAIFDCLITVPPNIPLAIRDQLPAQLTRRGFPDIAWEEFFEPDCIAKREAEDLMRQLRDSSAGR